MGKGNWIKLNRSIRKHFLWDFSKPLYLMAWVDILMSANFADKKTMIDSKVVLVKRGAFITSTVQLSKKWQCSRGTVDRILTFLEEDKMITTERTRRYTTVTVENYALYQDKPTTDRATDDTTDDTTDRAQDKNSKEIYKNIYKNNIKNSEEREEARARGGGEGADEKDDFHKMLEDNQELFNRLREKRSKGECDAG